MKILDRTKSYYPSIHLPVECVARFRIGVQVLLYYILPFDNLYFCGREAVVVTECTSAGSLTIYAMAKYRT